jgi:hypothetical protein
MQVCTSISILYTQYELVYTQYELVYTSIYYYILAILWTTWRSSLSKLVGVCLKDGTPNAVLAADKAGRVDRGESSIRVRIS